MSSTEADSLTTRLDRLERDARRWRWVAAMLVGTLGITGLLAATTARPVPVADEIRTKRLVVVDGQGRDRVLLGEDLFRGIGLRVLDASGTLRVVLGVKHLVGDTPYLALIDQSPGWVRFSVELADDGSPSLELFSPVVRDKPLLDGGGPNVARAQLSLGADGSPVLYLRDQNRTPRVVLGRMNLTVTEIDTSNLREIREIGKLQTPVSSLRIYDHDGKVLFKAP
ncbi:MAG TPA: hypothetical protein VNL98_01555 [Gemmatimonadales bacterium]|nr:hypothetical protein [Gemmatimonadales bacterium]